MLCIAQAHSKRTKWKKYTVGEYRNFFTTLKFLLAVHCSFLFFDKLISIRFLSREKKLLKKGFGEARGLVITDITNCHFHLYSAELQRWNFQLWIQWSQRHLGMSTSSETFGFSSKLIYAGGGVTFNSLPNSIFFVFCWLDKKTNARILPFLDREFPGRCGALCIFGRSTCN